MSESPLWHSLGQSEACISVSQSLDWYGWALNQQNGRSFKPASKLVWPACTSLRQQFYSCFGGGCTWWWENHRYHNSLGAFANQSHLKQSDGCFTSCLWHIWPLAHARIRRNWKCLCLSLLSYNSSTGRLSPLKSDFLSGTKAEGHWSCTDYETDVKMRKTRSVLVLGRA